MGRPYFILKAILIICLIGATAWAGQDPLEGRWTGKVQSIQGEREATVTFKKSGSDYTGAVSGLRGNSEVPFKEVKLDGSKVTAVTEVESPQGTLVINYNFVLAGETLKGIGEIDFGGQTFSFDFDLKRSGDAAQPAAPSRRAGSDDGQQRGRSRVPQPQQEQTLEYFVGQWTFEWLGRESALGPGRREGTVTFTLSPDGKTLESRTEAKSYDGAFQESAVITFDGEKKILSFTESRSNGVRIISKGDWSSPIAIRFAVEPVKVKDQTIQLRRKIEVISGHSFSVTEEISEDGGPFVRLGSALYSKVMSPAK